MGCVNDKSSNKSMNHSHPLNSKPYLQESSQVLKEYMRIEKELFKSRNHLNNLLLSQKKQEIVLNNFCFAKNGSLNDISNEWTDQTYHQEMQQLGELEKKAFSQPVHYQVLIEKISRIRSNFVRIIKSFNNTRALHQKLISMGQKYGVQNHQDFEVAYNELKKQEDKFQTYFDRNQTRSKISLTETTQTTNCTI